MSVTTRESQLDALRNNPNPDVLVVGGGINGIGTYRDLALQGVNVVLVERDDFCSGASTALSRMVHGGLRYMENGEFDLVKESLNERNLLLKNAPHYVSPLPTIIPIFDYMSGVIGAVCRFLKLSTKPSKRGALIIKAGLTLYDLFTRKDRVMPVHNFRGKTETVKGWPDFHPGVKCSATYFDAWITYPERLGLEMIKDIETANPKAMALNYMNVDGSDGKSVLITDSQTQEKVSVTPRMIVNATGAWIDFTNGALSSSRDNQKTDFVGGTKGSHLVIRNDKLLKATGNQMVYYENKDGRVCVLFPYFGNVLVGSTDLKLDDPEGNRCEDFEREYILESLSFIFPDIEIDPTDILYAFSGVRPLLRSNGSITGQITRDHYCKIISDEEKFQTPVLCMVGGKWTTFRAFGEQAADKVMDTLGISRKKSTRDIAIGGGRDFPARNGALVSWVSDFSEISGLDIDQANNLVERYGANAKFVANYLNDGKDNQLSHLPTYTRREIEYIIDHEHVVTLGDIFFRRTSIAISGAISMALIDEILPILAKKKSWDNARSSAERSQLLSRLSYYHGLSEETLRQRELT
jgi:glycerol-3-phosphate dehydrogenase